MLKTAPAADTLGQIRFLSTKPLLNLPDNRAKPLGNSLQQGLMDLAVAQPGEATKKSPEPFSGLWSRLPSIQCIQPIGPNKKPAGCDPKVMDGFHRAPAAAPAKLLPETPDILIHSGVDPLPPTKKPPDWPEVSCRRNLAIGATR